MGLKWLKKNLPSGSKPGGTSVPTCHRTRPSVSAVTYGAHSKAVYSTVLHYTSCLLSHLSTSPTRYPQAASSSLCFIHPSSFCPAVASRICPICRQPPSSTQDRNCSGVTWALFSSGKSSCPSTWLPSSPGQRRSPVHRLLSGSPDRPLLGLWFLRLSKVRGWAHV